jgi:hypothetical protein
LYNQKQQLTIRISLKCCCSGPAAGYHHASKRLSRRAVRNRHGKRVLKVFYVWIAGGTEPVEIHQLRYFCAIVSHGTFTRAAQAEHVSQPSLSQQILKLEDELGGKLFHRLPRTARLTALGEIFLPRALVVLQQIRESKAEARSMVELQKLKPAESVVSPAPHCRTNPSSSGNSMAKALAKSA